MAENKCTGDHSVHFCKYAEERKFDKITEAAGTPGSICTNCGRVANSKENLCNPVSFEELFKDGVYIY